jgi:hypothetical protein
MAASAYDEGVRAKVMSAVLVWTCSACSLCGHQQLFLPAATGVGNVMSCSQLTT